MKLITQVLAGLLALVMPLGAKADETRTPVTDVVATCNYADIIGYAKEVKTPTFTMADGSVASIPPSMINWQKKDGENWNNYYVSQHSTFEEGTYRINAQVRVDGSYGLTHVLANPWTFTVNGQAWTTGEPSVDDTYSYDWGYSPEITVTKEAIPLKFENSSRYEIPVNYQNKAIKSYSVADGVRGGVEPYTFSKVSGPEWINVANDGVVSGTPTAIGSNSDLVVRVTDAADATAEITITVGETAMNPADRTPVTDVVATCNYADIIGYAKEVKTPTFTMADGSVASIPPSMINWQKKDGENWNNYYVSQHSTFEEGTYRINAQVRVDGSYGLTHVLANPWTFTVNGQAWTTGEPSVDDTYSCDWGYSPEIIVSMSGICSISADETKAAVPVYNLQGIMVKRNADDLSGLPAGIYIVDGKKISVK